MLGIGRTKTYEPIGRGDLYVVHIDGAAAVLVFELADAITPRLRTLVILAGSWACGPASWSGYAAATSTSSIASSTCACRPSRFTGSGRVVSSPESEAALRRVTLPTVGCLGAREASRELRAAWRGRRPLQGPAWQPDHSVATVEDWYAARTAANAPEDLRIHDLRHHAATLTAQMPGITTKELMARIGHSSPRAALIHHHATDERDRDIAAFLDQVIEP